MPHSVPGPVRLYSTTKYNRDLLPTGRVDPETLRRLGPLLADDTAFSQARRGCAGLMRFFFQL